MKSLIKKFIPKFILSWYHLFLAYLADFIYGKPSKKIIVIGVTGTNGKSTTISLISKILEQAGFKTALSSTINFKIGEKEWLNNLKMTMPGRFFLQKLLSDAVKSDCQFVIIESSSEGILQHRYVGVRYDAMVFTNLTSEHIEAHKGFENYKNAKLEYFRHLERLPEKIINGKKISKLIIANADDQYSKEFLNFSVDKKITYGKNPSANFVGINLKATEKGIKFKINESDLSLNLKGIFDFYNALAAIAVTNSFGVNLETAKQALEKIPNVPGRMELIDEGQNFKVLVDYAPEPQGLKQLYTTVKNWHHEKIIHVLGSTGGGRDIARRKILGQIAGELADFVIVSNEDPYNDNPQQIIDDVAMGALDKGKILEKNLFEILDRRMGIVKALNLANQNDLVIITGKGSEQKMAVKNGYIPWDDREVVREEIKKLIKSRGNSVE